MGSEVRSVQTPPEQVTLVYRCLDGGAHSFSALEVPGLVVLEHDLLRAYNSAVKGVGHLVSIVCGKPVEYDLEMTFEAFQEKVERQSGTVNRERVVTVPGRVHRTADAIA